MSSGEVPAEKGARDYEGKQTEMEKAGILWICTKEILVHERGEAPFER
jgi:hypothetical protein